MSRAKQRLRDKGIQANEVSPSRMMLVPHTSLVIAPKGHPLYDPRSADPVREELATDMVARVEAGEHPNTDAILVWEQPDGLLVGDGHGREKALRRAAEILGRSPLMCLVQFFDGDEKGFLLERARRNDHGRFAKLDKPSVLAFRVKQLTAVGATEREIADHMPRGIGPAEVAALARWNSLAADARARFDDGAPIGLLAAVLEEERSDQVAALDKLLAAGIRTQRGATRKTNAERDARDPWARRMSPRQLLAVADIVHKRVDTVLGRGIEVGLRLAAGKDIDDVLRGIPTTTAAAIREARAAKEKKAPR